MKEIFLLTFNVEDEFKCIDEALQEIKTTIFRTPIKPITWMQPDWRVQLQHTLECYNVTTEEDDEDLRNMNIPELEGLHEVAGLDVEILDTSHPVKTKHVNIGLEAEPKFAHIGDYWDEDTLGKVAELLHEYQDLFLTKFSELKGDLGVMKINLKTDVKPVKEHPYRLNPKYKEKVREELDKMLVTSIIEPIEELKWVSLMVVQEKKTKGDIRICVDL